MQIRLLVMNGSKIVQGREEGSSGWMNRKVDKAGALKPGIYNLYMSGQADKTKRYDGVIVHADNNSVFQKVGKGFVNHSRSDFGDKIPEIGSEKSIFYDSSGKAITSSETVKLSQSRSRS
jgi:hypothetical protein